MRHVGYLVAALAALVGVLAVAGVVFFAFHFLG
jgi:hypothetical protein